MSTETAMETFERLRKWRYDDRKRAWRNLWYARMFNKGVRRLALWNGMPLFKEHASEKSIEQAIKTLNMSSWEHHR